VIEIIAPNTLVTTSPRVLIVREWLAAYGFLLFRRLATPELFNQQMVELKSPLRMLE
jgi:hypothetical protein